MRVNPHTGAIEDSSEIMVTDFFQPRMAIESTGIIYVTNGGFSQGALYSFDPDLTTRWSEPISNVNIGGPAIGQNGTLVVCGTGTDVRAYRGAPLDVEEDRQIPYITTLKLLQNYPNPFNATTKIEYELPSQATVSIEIYDLIGRRVTALLNELQPAGHHQVVWNAKDQSSGTYFYRIRAGEMVETKKMILMK